MAASQKPWTVCLTQQAQDLYLEQAKQALPDLHSLLLDEEGRPLNADEKPGGALLLSYDLFIAALGNPAIGENLARFAAECDWVQAGSAGDNPMLDAVRSVSQQYCNAAGMHAVPIAQYVMLQLLRWCMHLDRHAEQQKQNLWQPFMSESELTGLRLGILGYGGIGREVGRLARTMGMEVFGWRRNPEPCEQADAVLAGDEGLEQILRRSDCIVLSLPHSEQTQGLMNSKRFGLMKPGAVLVNVGRGTALDEEALADALQSGHLAFAALDTTILEPLPQDSPLWGLENCHITPHDSAWSPHSARRLGDLFCDNLARWRAGKPLRNALMPQD